jgi:anti-sigma factor RsiW
VTCEEIRPWIHPYVDGELDLVRSLEIQRHLDACPACAQARDRVEAVRGAVRDAALRHTAPAQLGGRIRSALRESLELPGGPNVVGRTTHGDFPVAASGGGVRSMPWRWFTIAAALFVLVSLAGAWTFLNSRNSVGEFVAQEIFTNHVRSLLADPLMDVASTDQHTVKPWFAGKLDFSPPVEDLADAGFVLSGGRLDVIGDETVAVLVYRRHNHVINLFVWPKTAALAAPSAASTRNGYHLRYWTGHEMQFAAVSDLNETELQEFIRISSQRLAAQR